MCVIFPVWGDFLIGLCDGLTLEANESGFYGCPAESEGAAYLDDWNLPLGNPAINGSG